MKIYIYRIWKCAWGILQTLLGLFVFVSAELFFAPKFKGQFSAEECYNRLLVHEYGHTIQSLMLGPLYLIVIGIPSTLWGFLMGKRRKEKQIPYGAFFTEKWANNCGEYVTGEKSIGNMVIE